MALSRIRQQGSRYAGQAPLTPESDLATFEVFTQKERGLPHVHAGALHAPDTETALQLAREHYGQDEPCAHLWVVRREHLAGTGSETDPINKAIEHTYRYARGYQHVHKMWQRFRDPRSLNQYEQEDLKEAF